MAISAGSLRLHLDGGRGHARAARVVHVRVDVIALAANVDDVLGRRDGVAAEAAVGTGVGGRHVLVLVHRDDVDGGLRDGRVGALVDDLTGEGRAARLRGTGAGAGGAVAA